MQQSTAVPRQNRFMKKSECCIAEQFLDRKTPGKERMLQSRSFPGQKYSWKRDGMLQSSSWIERFLEKTGCCRAERFLDRIDFWKRRDAAQQSSSWIEQIYGKDGMLQSRAFPGQNRFMEKTGCCKAEQSTSRIEQIPGKDRMLQSRAVPGQNRFMEKTGCCIAEQFLDRIDFWKRQDAAQQSSSWIEQIPGKDGMLQSKAVSTGQNRFLKKTECCRAEQCRQIDRLIAVIANYYIVDITLQKKLYSNISDMQY